MQSLYPFAHTIHLICAVIFVGYLFFDVVIFTLAKKKLPKEMAQSCSKAIGSIAIKIMPICLLTLILTGGMMMSNWVNSEIGYFSSPTQILFMIKVLLATIILTMVIINLSCKFIFKVKNPLGNIHPIALTLAATILLLAKLMVYI